MTLEQFADIIDVDLDIKYYANQGGRFCVKFQDGAIKDGPTLSYKHGNGTSYLEAVTNYIEKIKGQKLIVGAYSDSRKEFNVPMEFDNL